MSTKSIVLDEKFAQEMSEIIEEFKKNGIGAVETRTAKLMENYDQPANVTQGLSCSACASCGACPVTYIKTGYLLHAFSTAE
jgi:hypothetical protein